MHMAYGLFSRFLVVSLLAGCALSPAVPTNSPPIVAVTATAGTGTSERTPVGSGAAPSVAISAPATSIPTRPPTSDAPTIAATTAVPRTSATPSPSSALTVTRAQIGDAAGDVAPTDPLRIAFSRPMDRRTVEQALKLEPAVPGRFVWQQDDSVTYTPERPWPEAALISATLGMSAKSTSGETLQAPFTWSFITEPRFDIVEVSPADGADGVPTNAVINIVFSRPVDQTTFGANVSIVPAVEGTFQWQGRTATYVPTRPLPLKTSFAVVVSTGVRSTAQEALPANKTWHFTTQPLAPAPPKAIYPSGGRVIVGEVGQPHTLAFTGAGVPSVHLALFRVPSVPAFVGAVANKPQAKQPPVDTTAFTLLKEWDAPLPGANPAEIKQVEVAGTENAGVYYIRESAPGSDSLSGQFLVVSGRGVLVKQSWTSAFVWVTSLASGKPVVGVPVTIFDATDGIQLGTGATADDGTFEASVGTRPRPDGPPGPPELIVVSGSGTDLGVGGTMTDFYTAGFVGAHNDYRIYAYTERPIYRPGSTVHICGIVRANDDARYRVVADLPVRLVVTSPVNNSQIANQVLKTDARGEVITDIALDTHLPTGSYALQFLLAEQAAQNAKVQPGQGLYTGSFQVEEFRKPEYAVTVRVPDGPFFSGDQVPVTVAARYYFDQPVRDARVTLSVQRSAWFESSHPGSAQQADPEAAELGTFTGRGGGTQVLTRDATLDVSGTASFMVPADLGTLKESQDYTFVATVLDAANHPVSNVTSAVVHRGARRVYVTPASFTTRTDAPLSATLLVQDLQETPQPNVPVQCRVIEQTYEVTQEGNQKGAWPISHLVEVTAYGFTATTGSTGSANARIQLPHAAGYRLNCTVKDDRGNSVERDTYLRAAFSSGAMTPYSLARDQITVTADRATYAVGDTARIQVLSAIGDVPALVTVERGKVYTHQLVQISGNSTTFGLAVTPDNVPNVQVTVSIQGKGDILMGSAVLRVPATQRYLSVAVKPDKERYQPGEKATLTVSAKDAEGKPAQGTFSLGVVDAALYALVDSSGQSIKGAFFGPQPWSVTTGASLSARPGRLRGGGYGGGGGGSAAPPGLRTNFPDTAYWSPNVQTDATGNATVQMTMPDSLTTWRLTAIGVTPTTQVGYVVRDVVTTQPFQVRPILPRFFTVGDTVQLDTIVQNDTDAAVTATVRLRSSEVRVEGASEQQARVPARGSAVVSWHGAVGAASLATVQIDATAGSLTDATKLTLPVLPGGTPRSVDRAGELRAGSVDAALAVPPDALANSASVSLAITPSLASGVLAGATMLSGYPYDCAEQTISSFLPLILAREVYGKAGLNAMVDRLPHDLDRRVATDVQRLATLQHPDGGWNWWEYDQTDPYMTAYAVYAIFQAQRLGYPIIDDSLRRGIASLQQQLNSPAAGLATRAYMLDVLAIIGQGDVAKTHDLAARTDGMAQYGLSYLAQALQSGKDTERAKQVLTQLGTQAKQTDTTASWHESIDDLPPMRGSDVYSTAVALDAYTRVDPDNPLAIKAVRFLLASRIGEGWSTTHDSAIALMALNRYLLAHGDLQSRGSYKVEWNGQVMRDIKVEAGAPSDSPASLEIPAAQIKANNTLKITHEGTASLFWSASLRYRVAAPMVTQKSPIQVTRSYVRADGTPVNSPVTAGDVVTVRVRVQTSTPLEYVLVSDQLPAGLEPLNPALATSGPQGGQNPAQREEYSHRDLRDSEAAFYVTKLSAGDHTFTYQAQASTPGSYQAPPAVAWQMYDPAVMAASQPATVVVGR